MKLSLAFILESSMFPFTINFGLQIYKKINDYPKELAKHIGFNLG